jgi:diguanylate cyclase (GGDEF)-like protein
MFGIYRIFPQIRPGRIRGTSIATLYDVSVWLGQFGGDRGDGVHGGGRNALQQPERPALNMTQAFRELVQIGITLTSEQDLGTLLERILTEARRFTRAEAGTLFLREGDQLRFSVVQNDKLARELGQEEMRRRLQADPLSLRELSLAGHVALTGDILNLHDTYMIPPDRPYSHDPRMDARLNYRTQSILVVPLQDPANNILGVLELINAIDRGRVVPFDSQYEGLVRSLASQAAVALRNARLEDLSFKDALTDVYNRRYFAIRMEEEFKRHCRFGEPLSLALMDLDHFKEVNDRFGHRAGDQALRDVAQLLVKHSRSFSIVTRYGGDEFAIILVNTAKAGGLTYAERIRAVVEQHPFAHGPVTVSLGVASLPEDATTVDDLTVAADQALYDAKRLGRNRVAVQ